MTAVGLARKLGIAALVGAYSLVFGEVFLRVMAPQAILPRFVTGTPLGIRGNIPGARYRQWTPETEVEIRINAQGLRADREFAREKPSGTCRVALLGDSYLLGFENDLPDSIAGRLQARFDASPWRVEVLDFAVSGFGTAEMLVQFDGEVAAFAPDVTVFQFHASDLRDNVRTARLFEEDARTGTLRRTKATYLPGVAVQDRLMHFAAYRWAIEHSHLYTAVRERAALLGKDLLFALGRRDARDDAEDGDGASEAGEVGADADAGGDAAGAADAGADPLAAPARATGRLLAHACERVRAAGSDFLVLDVPTVLARTRFASRVGGLGLAPDVAARVVPLLPVLEAHAAPDVKLFYEQGHKHMTPLGNGLAADALFERIARDAAGRLAACRNADAAADTGARRDGAGEPPRR